MEKKAQGRVFLVGAGPGDPELMTVKGRRLIESCDALVYDYLVNQELLGWLKPGAERHYVGKQAGFHSVPQSEIETLLVRLAREGKSVVRLKGGDPFVFGRGGEEAETLCAHAISFEIVPAVTAALGCAAYAGTPLTHRQHSSAVTFVSGHEQPNKAGLGLDWEQLARTPGTLVLYMAMGRLAEITKQLLEGGRSGDTPVVVVQWGTTERQREVHGKLDSIAEEVEKAKVGSPSVVIIGEVAALGEKLRWFDPTGRRG